MAILAGEQPLHVGHGALQFGFSFGKTRGPVAGGPRLPDDLWTPAGPFRRGNEIGLGISIAATVRHPDITGAEGTAEGPQGAQLVIPAANCPVLLADIGAPRVRHKPQGRLAGDRGAFGGAIE